MKLSTNSGTRAASCWAWSTIRGTASRMKAVTTSASAMMAALAARERGIPLDSSQRTSGSMPRLMNAAVTIQPTSPPTLVST